MVKAPYRAEWPPGTGVGHSLPASVSGLLDGPVDGSAGGSGSPTSAHWTATMVDCAHNKNDPCATADTANTSTRDDELYEIAYTHPKDRHPSANQFTISSLDVADFREPHLENTEQHVRDSLPGVVSP
jgi:hypothetical protein